MGWIRCEKCLKRFDRGARGRAIICSPCRSLIVYDSLQRRRKRKFYLPLYARPNEKAKLINLKRSLARMRI